LAASKRITTYEKIETIGMKKELRILLVEDSEDDALLLLHHIERNGYTIDYERIETPDRMYDLLKEKKWDLVLSDYVMPHFNGLEALAILQESGIDIPFIIISGTIGEEIAVESMKAGAHDYLMKNNLKRLIPAIERELRESNSRAIRKQAEEKLRILSRAVDQSPAMILITNTEGTIEYINPKFTEVTGYSQMDAVGKNPRILKSNKMPDSYYKEMWNTLKAGNTWSNEMINKKKNGDLYWVNISISPIFDVEGTITHYVGLSEDITQKKKTEEELIKAKEHAEESDRLKTAFLHNISHEIRTPMNSIIGFSELLVSNFDNKENLKQFAQIITQRSTDLLEIINSILDIATIESGQLPIRLENCNLRDVFDDLSLFFGEYQQRNNKQSIEFSMKSSPESSDLVIKTDVVKLKQIFINLITNSFKYTLSGKIEAGYKFEDNYHLLFYVSDTGIGIPKDAQKIIFERFTKLNQGNYSLQDGTGLGLSIVKELTEMLGGSVWFESELGKGSTFFFTISYEMILSTPHQTPTIMHLENEKFSNCTILIVEDDPSNTLYLNHLLSGLGFTLLYTHSGMEAVDMASKLSIDLVLMDIGLPDISGYEAAHLIKAQNKNVKIIAQTAYATQEDIQKVLNSECDDHICKPFNRKKLLPVIKKYLNKA
jgi:PAS domain S-box-containing protein